MDMEELFSGLSENNEANEKEMADLLSDVDEKSTFDAHFVETTGWQQENETNKNPDN